MHDIFKIHSVLILLLIIFFKFAIIESHFQTNPEN